MILIHRTLNFSEDPEGVQHFSGGPTFSRGGGRLQMLISEETHLMCFFRGGGLALLSPLCIRT